MKKIALNSALVFLPLLFCISAFSQSANKNYDSVLAKKLGADEYGMKQYILVILKSGTNTTSDKTVRDSLFQGHLANIGRLADHGDMVLAGPLVKNDNNYRGIFVLNVKTTDEAKKLLETDPAIRAKLLEPDLYVWYGSAAIVETAEIHKKIQKTSLTH
jgi:uncharacterized protein YciI